MSIQSEQRYDIIIAGGGLVGCALALGLANSRFRILLVEAGAMTSGRWAAPEAARGVDRFDARVSALTPVSREWLETLGVWEAMASRRVTPFTGMTVWDGEGTGSINFSAQELHQPALGYIVENRITQGALFAQLTQADNITLAAPCRVSGISPAPQGGYRVTLDEGPSVETALLVGADGANSPIRQMAGIGSREWDYNHHAIVATVKTARSHEGKAWQRFMTTGPLAFLPLTGDKGEDHYASIVWSCVPQLAERLAAEPERVFANELAEALEYRLGEVESVSRRFSFPLRQRHARQYIKSGLALVGDAAHTIHPLAGQGVNLGLQDAAALVEELLSGAERGIDPGNAWVLSRYQRRRLGANLAMAGIMEGFKQLFAQDQIGLRWLRNTGMRWLNSQTTFKKRVAMEAMGLSGPLAALSKQA